jgi:hypothetical protein
MRTVRSFAAIPSVCARMNIHAAPEASVTSRLRVPQAREEQVHARWAPIHRMTTAAGEEGMSFISI